MRAKNDAGCGFRGLNNYFDVLGIYVSGLVSVIGEPAKTDG